MSLAKLIEEKRRAKLREERNKKAKSAALGASIGIATGLAAGILFAPKSGKETRDDLRASTADLNELLKERAAVAKEKTAANLEDAKSRISQYIESTKNRQAAKKASLEEAIEVVIESTEDVVK